MSLASDLAGAFEEFELTVPVQCGGSSTRAFFNRAGSIVKSGGVPVQVEHDTLFIQRGALDPDLGQEVQVQVGEVGADPDDEDPWYRVTLIEPIEDGLLQSVAIGGGTA
jgi:hypothetical protein